MAAVTLPRAVPANGEWDLQALKEEVHRWKEKRRAVILAHNYQVPEVQDVADFVGDSLGLSRAAAKSDAQTIVFCGVHFMAETAAVLCPDKKVLLPDLEAGCSLAATINAEDVRRWRAKHPDGIVVTYVNTSAAVKAESDYCCTSGNAVDVIRAVPEGRPLLFAPDFFMGAYLRKVTGRSIDVWMGECHVHAGIRPEHLNALKAENPEAELLIHPECGCMTNCLLYMADGDVPNNGFRILSTEGMMKQARAADKSKFIVATETGILYRMRKENPDKEFIPAYEGAVCQYMKTITLPKVLRSLREDVYPVTVPEPIATRARAAIDRMVRIG